MHPSCLRKVQLVCRFKSEEGSTQRLTNESETSRESREGPAWVSWVLEAERRELDEVVRTGRANMRVRVEDDGAVLADIDARSGDDILQTGLLELATSAEINGGRANLGEKRSNAVVFPVDCAFEGRGALVSCNGLCDLYTGETESQSLPRLASMLMKWPT